MTAVVDVNVPTAIAIIVAVLVVAFLVLAMLFREPRTRRSSRTRVGVFVERELEHGDELEPWPPVEGDDTLEIPPPH